MLTIQLITTLLYQWRCLWYLLFQCGSLDGAHSYINKEGTL